MFSDRLTPGMNEHLRNCMFIESVRSFVIFLFMRLIKICSLLLVCDNFRDENNSQKLKSSYEMQTFTNH